MEGIKFNQESNDPHLKKKDVVSKERIEIKKQKENDDSRVKRVDGKNDPNFISTYHHGQYLVAKEEEQLRRIERLLPTYFEDLTPREKFYLIAFLKETKQHPNNLQRFYTKNGINGVRSLIIGEYDVSKNDEIIRFAEENEDSKKLFEILVSFLDSSESFCDTLKKNLENSSLSKENSLALSGQIFEALLRKAKDLFLTIIDSKKIKNWYETTDKTPEEKEEVYQESIQALRGYVFCIDLLSKFFLENKVYKTEVIEMPQGQTNQFLIKDSKNKEYRLKFNVRPVAEKNAQARINIEINFDTENPNDEMGRIFYQETKWLNNKKRKKVQKESVFRMGLDLDTENPLKPGLSLDIGRSAIESEKRIATGETLGNLLDKASPESTHTPYSFDSKFANPELFEKLAKQFKRFLQAKMSN